jgi:hypothetical protein
MNHACFSLMSLLSRNKYECLHELSQVIYACLLKKG